MVSKLKEVWLVVDDYTPDAGSTIYGVFATQELAEARLEVLCSEDNEYEEDVGSDCDIRTEAIYYE